MTISTIARGLLRAVIVALVVLALWHFSDFYGKAIVTLTGGQAQWLFSRTEAFLAGVAAPLCALAAAGFAIAGRRLVVASLLLVAALLLYVSPILPFAIGVAIHEI